MLNEKKLCGEELVSLIKKAHDADSNVVRLASVAAFVELVMEGPAVDNGVISIIKALCNPRLIQEPEVTKKVAMATSALSCMKDMFGKEEFVQALNEINEGLDKACNSDSDKPCLDESDGEAEDDTGDIDDDDEDDDEGDVCESIVINLSDPSTAKKVHELVDVLKSLEKMQKQANKKKE
jgi:hypothetical protein